MKNKQSRPEHEFTKSQNLLRMLISIVRNPNKTPSEIARELDLPKATYYRYFTELSRIIPLNYNLPKKRFEFEKILSIEKITRFSDEFYLFLLMLQAIRYINCEPQSSTPEVMERLDAVDKEIRYHAENYILLYESGLPTQDIAEKLYKISCAIIGRRSLFFHYESIGKKYDVKVHPYKLVMDNFWYLHAYSCKRSACRSFKISRMDKIEILEETFEMPDSKSIDVGRVSINWDFSAEQTESTKVVLDFDNIVRKNIKENLFHKTQKLTDLPDGKLRMEVEVRNPSNMINWILGFGQFVTIVEPESLRSKLTERLQEIGKRYE